MVESQPSERLAIRATINSLVKGWRLGAFHFVQAHTCIVLLFGLGHWFVLFKAHLCWAVNENMKKKKKLVVGSKDLSADSEHFCSARRACSFFCFSAVFHCYFFGVFYFSFFFTFYAICFCHSYHLSKFIGISCI